MKRRATHDWKSTMTTNELGPKLIAACLAALGGIGAAQAQTVDPGAGDLARGKTTFARCAACHSVTGRNGIGPHLDGAFGRVAGKAEGFRYSPGMAASTRPWDVQGLEAFLAAPTRAVPGTTMPLNVPGAQDRADLIAYLRSLAAPR